MTDSREQRLDAVFGCLAAPRRRRVLSLMDASGSDPHSVGDLAERLVADSDSDATDGTSVEASLHHVHLPKLDAIGAVEYDARTGTVRYVRNPDVERALDFVDEVCAARPL